jgi:outer membrane protein assembly factor BamA
MKNKKLVTLILVLLWPIRVIADEQKPESNINERYTVEGIQFAGIDESKLSKPLREDAQKLVGEKYSEQSANDIAGRLREELKKKYQVTLKVEKGSKPEQVTVIFVLQKIHELNFKAELPLLVYHSKEGFSGSLEIPIETHHNVFTFGIVTDADRLLERYSGYRLRYEHRKLGTDALRLRLDFDTYHETFNAATREELEFRPDVPGTYRARQNFAPSVSVYPTKGLALSAGLSFQRLQFQHPALHTETAYAGTADVLLSPELQPLGSFHQDFKASYNLRAATRVLDSDFVYTRHFVTADYTISNGKNRFGFHFLGGSITGTSPLFERFLLGNSTTLRGWNKFDVAPLGGTRVAQGSLDYRYRQFEAFYDFGKVWESGPPSGVKHGLGFGWSYKHMFASLAFPVRLHDVAPVFMFGFRD